MTTAFSVSTLQRFEGTLSEGKDGGFGGGAPVSKYSLYYTTVANHSSCCKEGVATAFSVPTRKETEGTLNQGKDGGFGGRTPNKKIQSVLYYRTKPQLVL